MNLPAVSVLVPAYNEAAVIARSLAPLAEACEAGRIELIVIANGCRDETAQAARTICPAATVIETDFPSKTNALNLGAGRTTGRAIICLDADLSLPETSLMRLAEPILEGRADVACGRMEPDLAAAAPLVRAFYRGWQLNPYFDDGKFGGVFALSHQIMRGLFPLPEVVADDEYIARSTAFRRRAYVPEAGFAVAVPTTLRALFRIRRRSRRGTDALRLRGVCGAETHPHGGFGTAALRAARRPARWFDFAVYGAVMATVAISLKLAPAAPNGAWERDETSRLPTG
ncbi:glycosyltransferase family 2 protein [Aliiruegeria sabulilitoris]|uniref:glycosyltransferase family 2 protein n=1 Tax=Aliiruegeria sabulilitoris TaxID=1510458 RepID=UPI00082E04F0|nr:glycosyltransferase family 2 protein [Aliiruegeria sabulilitoris]NDR56289.1 glycosyltransferase [Pseudoruegeria sp. M32A2M]